MLIVRGGLRHALAVVALLVLAAGCGFGRPAAPAPAIPRGAVAMVDGEPVWVSDVQAHVRPVGPRVGSGPAIDPRRRALDNAIRVRLFAQEAKRRGLFAPTGPAAVVDAHLVQGLLRQERQRRGISAANIADDAARSYYRQHLLLFNRPEAVRVLAIMIKDPNLAETVLRQAGGTSEQEFKALAARHSTDRPPWLRRGALELDAHQIGTPPGGIDPALYPVAFSLRRPGEVGLAKGTAGRYYVLRATKLDVVYERWSASLAQRVRNLMVWEAEQRAAGELDRQLRARATIMVNDETLKQVRVAEEGAPAA